MEVNFRVYVYNVTRQNLSPMRRMAHLLKHAIPPLENMKKNIPLYIHTKNTRILAPGAD